MLLFIRPRRGTSGEQVAWRWSSSNKGILTFSNKDNIARRYSEKSVTSQLQHIAIIIKGWFKKVQVSSQLSFTARGSFVHFPAFYTKKWHLLFYNIIAVSHETKCVKINNDASNIPFDLHHIKRMSQDKSSHATKKPPIIMTCY